MKPYVLLLASLLGAGALPAQDPPKGVIEGIVVDEVTGEPVRRVSVALHGQRADKQPESTQVRTQADGRFRFEGLEAGSYYLTANRSGYLSPRERGGATPVQLSSGEQKTGLTLKLVAQSIISGRVFDEEGDPVQGAQIQVFQRQKMAGKLRWQPVNGSATNDRGEFRVTGLGAGEYAVSANYRDPGPQVNPKAKALPPVYATTYYPNSAGLNSAQGVAVLKGTETAGIDLHLRRESAYRVRVRVEGVSAELLRVTSVNLQPRDPSEGYARMGFGNQQLEPGLYELVGVRAGFWYVQAQLFQQGAEPMIGITPIEVSTGDLTDVVVRVGAGQQLTGMLVFEGTPAVKMNWKNYNVRLIATEGTNYGGGRPSVTEDGAFTVRYNVPGSYRLDVQGPQPDKTYLASIKVGSEEYFGKEIELTAGPPGPFKIIYRNDAGKVSGTLEGAAAEPGMAVLVPVERHLRRLEYMPAVPIRAGGAFEFNKVRPGEYLLCHLAGNYQTLAEEGEPPKESMDAAVRIKVEPNGAHSVQVKAVRPAPQQP